MVRRLSRFFQIRNVEPLEQRAVVGGDPYRSPAIIPPRAELPKLEVLDDYILVRDVSCVDADGNIFEYYPQLLVARDVERSGERIRFTPYQAAVHCEQQGKFNPSFALACNTLNTLLDYKKVEAAVQLLQQYKSIWHVHNTLINWKKGKIIHYPSKENFPIHEGDTSINNGKRTELPFNKRGLRSMPLEEALQDENAVNFLKNVTGLQDLSVLLKIGEYFQKDPRLWVFSSHETRVFSSNETRAAWLGCNGSYFNLGTNDDLYNVGAARGVREA